MDELEMLYFEKEQADIKAWCRKNKQTLKYRGETYYLYQGAIYDSSMDVIIPKASNGFLDLYEYFEYFPQNKEE
jgi:hypothetical protein